MQANLLVAKFSSKGTVSTDFQVNNLWVTKFSTCVRILLLRDLDEKSCIYMLGLVETEVSMYMTVTTNKFLNLFFNFM